jgi:hypothetical protein
LTPAFFKIPREIDNASDAKIADPPNERTVDRIIQTGSPEANIRPDGPWDCSGRSDDQYAHERNDHGKEESTVQLDAALNSDIAHRFLRRFGGIEAVILQNHRRSWFARIILAAGDRPYFSTLQSVTRLQ